MFLKARSVAAAFRGAEKTRGVDIYVRAYILRVGHPSGVAVRANRQLNTSTTFMWHKTLSGGALALALFLLGAPAGAAPQ